MVIGLEAEWAGARDGWIPAVDLHVLRFPTWAREALDQRMKNVRAATKWHSLARMVLDVSGLPAPHRPALHTLINRHGLADAVVDMQVTDIADRIPAARTNVAVAVRELVEWRWLDRLEHPGEASTFTLWIPWDPPPDRLRRSPGRARRNPGQPVASRDRGGVASRDRPVASRDRGVASRDTIRGKGQGAPSGADGVTVRDAVPRGAVEKESIDDRLRRRAFEAWGGQ